MQDEPFMKADGFSDAAVTLYIELNETPAPYFISYGVLEHHLCHFTVLLPKEQTVQVQALVLSLKLYYNFLQMECIT
jgi:hypothetical protein